MNTIVFCVLHNIKLLLFCDNTTLQRCRYIADYDYANMGGATRVHVHIHGNKYRVLELVERACTN